MIPIFIIFNFNVPVWYNSNSLDGITLIVIFHLKFHKYWSLNLYWVIFAFISPLLQTQSTLALSWSASAFSASLFPSLILFVPQLPQDWGWGDSNSTMTDVSMSCKSSCNFSVHTNEYKAQWGARRSRRDVIRARLNSVWNILTKGQNDTEIKLWYLQQL